VWKVIPPFGEFEARHAHNELLQQFYAYGVVGIGMLVGLYSSLYRTVRRLPRGPLKAFLLSMLIFVLVRGMADTEPFDISLPLWSIVLLSLLANDAYRKHDEAEIFLSHEQNYSSGVPRYLLPGSQEAHP
jgi:O-antigen ligase